MSHMRDRCDIIDRLEEAAKTGGSVAVQTSGGQSFVDRVRAVETESGEDYARFRDHGRVSVSDIRDCSRATPVLEASYDAKL